MSSFTKTWAKKFANKLLYCIPTCRSQHAGDDGADEKNASYAVQTYNRKTPLFMSLSVCRTNAYAYNYEIVFRGVHIFIVGVVHRSGFFLLPCSGCTTICFSCGHQNWDEVKTRTTATSIPLDNSAKWREMWWIRKKIYLKQMTTTRDVVQTIFVCANVSNRT